MLSRENNHNLFKCFFVSLFVIGCHSEQNHSDNKESQCIAKTFNQKNKTEYYEIYNQAYDSLKTWSLNNLGYYQYLGKSKTYYLDSILCFNSNSDRLIGSLLMGNLLPEANSDGIDFFYGEKINEKWYFFSGAHIVIPRSMVKGHPLNKPLSYHQLHQIALKEIYGGYLKEDGSINEEWFTSHFEGPGWGDFNQQEQSFKYLHVTKKFASKREFFEAIHLQSVRNNWYGVKKDSLDS